MMRNRVQKSVVAVGVALLTVCSWTGRAQAPQDAPPPPAGDHERGRGGREGGPGPERMVDNLTRVLNLNADQQKGVRTVLEQQREQMRAMRNKTSGDAAANEAPEARRAQMDSIRDESNSKISALLDDNQRKTFADWVEKRKAEMARRQNGGGPGGAGGEAPPPPPAQPNL